MEDDFDLGALYAAVEAARQARGLSWAAAAREIGVSPGMLRGLSTRRAVEGDGVLQVLRWLGRSPESFAIGDVVRGETANLPDTDAGVLRFDARALYDALDTRRAERGMTWAEVAAEIGQVDGAALRRLGDGGRVSFPQVMRVCAWLGRPAAQFVRVAAR